MAVEKSGLKVGTAKSGKSVLMRVHTNLNVPGTGSAETMSVVIAVEKIIAAITSISCLRAIILPTACANCET